MYAPHSAARFELLTRAGVGAMGEVYRARDLQTRKYVAVKLLHQRATDEERARFHRETATLADLRHPGIVNYVDHGTWTDGRSYFVMEWLDGEDLGRRTARKPLGMADSVEVVRRVAQAISAVHTRGIVHRDLKLTNVFVSYASKHKVKLIDFGVVKPCEPDDFVTSPGSIIGTPHFMAPEQAHGESVDVRADVYSLGAMLFRLVTGRHVFPTDHVIAFLGRLVVEDAPLASTVRFDVPRELDQVLAAALSRDREQRPDDAATFARMLARLPAMNNDPPCIEQGVATLRRSSDSKHSVVSHPNNDCPHGSLARRVVTVMLADLGIESFSDELAQKVRAILGRGAELIPFASSQLLAGFGLNRTRGDEAIRAADAALLIASAIPRSRIVIAIGHTTSGSDGVDCADGFGSAGSFDWTGSVAGNLTGNFDGDFDGVVPCGYGGIADELIQEAASALDKTPEGAVRVSPELLGLLRGRFAVHLEESGGVLLRGYMPQPDDTATLGVATATVGREAEVEELVSVYRRVMNTACPRAVIVDGPVGFGKSRLRAEVIRQLGATFGPFEVVSARGEATQGSISALGRAFRARMGIVDGEHRMSQMGKVTKFLMERGAKLVRDAAVLGEFVGVPFDCVRSEGNASLNAQLFATRVLDVLEMVLRHDAKSLPQVMVFDDIHLFDESSLDMIGWLLGCRYLRLVVYAFGREQSSDLSKGLWDKQSVTTVRLGALNSASCDSIARAVLPSLDGRRRRGIIERAEGNAWHLEELLRNAAEHRDDLPLSVEALTQARLDELSSAQRRVVRAASVFGRQFWSGGVSALVGRNVDNDLRNLEKAGVVSMQSSSKIEGQVEWFFRQNMVFETVYSSLTPPDRVAWHQAAADWLLQSGLQDPGTVARHSEAGGNHSRAALLYDQASQTALSKGRLEAAIKFSDALYRCATGAETRARASLRRAIVLLWLGRYEEQLDAAENAIVCAVAGTDVWADGHRLSALAMLELGRSSDAESRFGWVLACKHGELSLVAEARLHAARTRAFVDSGMATEAADSADLAVRCATEAGDSEIVAMAHALEAKCVS
ncbi:MAG: protein kinase, partial [Polyangiaceae bacterium]|nr:protein kinase [Polyangiaceae bacterium]